LEYVGYIDIYSTDKVGSRVYSEFKIGKGFPLRAEAGLLNTYVPPRLHSGPADPVTTKWVPGVFVGLKKEYKFIREVKCNAQIMLRIFNHEVKAPMGMC